MTIQTYKNVPFNKGDYPCLEVFFRANESAGVKALTDVVTGATLSKSDGKAITAGSANGSLDLGSDFGTVFDGSMPNLAGKDFIIVGTGNTRSGKSWQVGDHSGNGEHLYTGSGTTQSQLQGAGGSITDTGIAVVEIVPGSIYNLQSGGGAGSLFASVNTGDDITCTGFADAGNNITHVAVTGKTGDHTLTVNTADMTAEAAGASVTVQYQRPIDNLGLITASAALGNAPAMSAVVCDNDGNSTLYDFVSGGSFTTATARSTGINTSVTPDDVLRIYGECAGFAILSFTAGSLPSDVATGIEWMAYEWLVNNRKNIYPAWRGL